MTRSRSPGLGEKVKKRFASRETSSHQDIRKAIVGMCQRNRKVGQGEIHQ